MILQYLERVKAIVQSQSLKEAEEQLDAFVAEWLNGVKEKIKYTDKKHACNKVFANGDLIYRCIDCGADNTCVMCHECFQNSAHVKHQYSVHVSRQGGGLCDCGDSEAFSQHYACSLHQYDSSSDRLAETTTAQVDNDEAKVVDEFIKDVVQLLCLTLVLGHNFESVPSDFNRDIFFRQGDFPDHERFALILWNDEYHSFDEVIEIVEECSDEFDGRAVAQTVDQVGRHILHVSEDCEVLLRMNRLLVNQSGLAASIIPFAYVVYQECAYKLSRMLNQLSSESEQVRAFTSKHLLDVSVLSQLLYQNEDLFFMGTDNFWDLIAVPTSQLSAVKLLILLDYQLWKQYRQLQKELFGNVFLSGDSDKIQFSVQYSSLYDLMYGQYLNSERDLEHNLVHYSVQLFTTPSIAQALEQNRDKSQLKLCLETLCDELFVAQSDLLDEGHLFYTGRQMCQLSSDHNLFRRRLYSSIFNDAIYILQVKNITTYIDYQSVSRVYIQLLYQLQNMVSEPRKTGTHVEYERQDWIQAFNFLFSLGPLIQNMAQSLKRDGNKEDLLSLIQKQMLCLVDLFNGYFHGSTEDEEQRIQLVGGLGSLFEGEKDYYSTRFKVSVQHGTFFNPLYWSLGQICRVAWQLGLDFNDFMRQNPFSNVQSAVLGDALIEHPLRVMSLMAQVKAGLWVRNGSSVQMQMINYCKPFVRAFAYDSELFLLQMATLVISPQQLCFNIMDKFELVSLYQEGDSEGNQKLQFETSRYAVLIQEFLRLIIYLITDHMRPTGAADEAIMRDEVLHILFTGDKPYQEIAESLLGRFDNDSHQLGKILGEVADMILPEKLDAVGLFRVKDQYLKLYNCFHFQYSGKQLNDSLLYMTERGWTLKDSQVFLDNCLAALESSQFNVLLNVVRLLVDLIYDVVIKFVEENEIEQLFAFEVIYLLQMYFHPRVYKSSSCSRSARMVLKQLKECDAYADYLDVIEEFLCKESAPGLAQRDIATTDGSQSTEQSASEQKVNDELQRSQSQRDLAREKQKAIMEQFKKAQSSFVASVQEEYDDTDDHDEDMMDIQEHSNYQDAEQQEPCDACDKYAEELDQKWESDHGNCMACQEQLVFGEKEFGIVAYMSIQSNHKLYNAGQVDFSADEFNNYATTDSMDAKMQVKVAHQFTPQLYTHSCGHAVHFECFQQLPVGLNSIVRCPLCNSVCNVVIPQEKNLYLIAALHKFSDYHSFQQMLHLFGQVIDCDAFPRSQPPASLQMLQFRNQLCLINRYKDPYNNARVQQRKQELRDTLSQMHLVDVSDLFQSQLSTIIRAQSCQYSVYDGEVIKSLVESIADAQIHAGNNHLSEVELRLLRSLVALVSQNRILAGVDFHGQVYDAYLCEMICGKNWIPSQRNEVLIPLIQSLRNRSILLAMHSEQFRMHLFSYLILHNSAAMIISAYGPGSAFLWQLIERVNEFGNQRDSINFRDYQDTLDSMSPVQRFTIDVLHLVTSCSTYFQGHLKNIDHVRLDKFMIKYVLDRSEQQWIDFYDGWNARVKQSLSVISCIFELDTSLRESQFQKVHNLSISSLVTLQEYKSVYMLIMSQLSEYDDSLAQRSRHLPRNHQQQSEFQYTSSSIDMDAALDDLKQVASRIPLLDNIVPYFKVFTPIELPHTYNDVLVHYASQQCKECNTVPNEIGVCLLCGKVVCVMGYCCLDRDQSRGECNAHMSNCCIDAGMFLVVKKCKILLLARNIGACYVPAPYLDVNGTTQIGNVMTLNKRRYQQLVQMYLKNDIPQYIASKVERLALSNNWQQM
ncbi:hypothetical protein MP228_003406 [Amoeboaphelidium protococcarum]|nr:hypothetical protein MP228_003406 [Amoeboaphelidium protococcarum]